MQPKYKNPRFYRASTVYMLVVIIVMLVAMLGVFFYLYLEGFAPLYCQDYTYGPNAQKLCLTPVTDYKQKP